MGINATNTQSYYLEALKNQQPQNNFRLANSYVNTPMFNNNVQQPAVDSFNNKTVTPADGKDDGSIGFVKAVGNLFTGVGNFFKGMVCDENGKFSITRTLTTIGIGAAIGVACAFLPTIAVAGMTFSTLGLISAGFGAIAAYHIGDAAIDIMSAKTDAEAEQGWQNLGSGLTEGGLAYLGYRASGGIMAKDTVAPTPSGSTPKTPKTPKATTEEAPVEPTRTSAPKTETPVEEPVVETPKTESVVEPEAPKVETQKTEVVEPKYTEMTPEAKESYIAEFKNKNSDDAMNVAKATIDRLTELVKKHKNGEKLSAAEQQEFLELSEKHQLHKQLRQELRHNAAQDVVEFRKKSLDEKAKFLAGKKSHIEELMEKGKNEELTFEENFELKKYNLMIEDAATNLKISEAKSVKAKAEAEAKKVNPAINEAKLKAEKELEQLSKEIPNMSRSSIAQQRRELNRFGCEIDMLEMKAKKECLTELENVRLNFLKQKLSLLDAREKQIAQSIEPYVPTVSDNSAVSMHHYINGENTSIRDAISAKAKNPSELSERQIKNLERMEKRMAQIDREFEQLPPLEKDCIVYRGRAENPIFKRFNGDFEIMGKAKVGDTVIPDTGYSYTAFNYDMANNWCQGGRMTDMNNNPLRTIMYEIRLPKGAKVSRNLEHGGEVVMPRSAQYKVLDKKVGSNGDIEVVLEYILPKA